MKIKIMRDEQPRLVQENLPFKVVTKKGNHIQSNNYVYGYNINLNGDITQNTTLSNPIDIMYNDCIQYLTNQTGELDKVIEHLQNRNTLPVQPDPIISYFDRMAENFNKISNNELLYYFTTIVSNILYSLIENEKTRINFDIKGLYDIYINDLGNSVYCFLPNYDAFRTMQSLYEFGKLQNRDLVKYFTEIQCANIKMIMADIYQHTYQYIMPYYGYNQEMVNMAMTMILPYLTKMKNQLLDIAYNILCRYATLDLNKIEIIMSIRYKNFSH